MDEGFFRQRRNLISISIALMLYMIAGGDINSLFGIKLEHNIVAIIFTWVGFFYFWWRCVIYGPDSIDRLFENEKRTNQSIDPFIINHGMRLLKEATDDIEQNLQVSFGLKKDNVWGYTFGHNNTNHARKYKEIAPIVNGKLLLLIFIRSWIRTAYSGKVFTDYFIPYFLAEVTLLIGIYKLSANYL